MGTQTPARATLPEYLSIADAAAPGILNCHPDTIRRMVSRGELKAYRFGRLIRIKRDDLEKAMKPVTNAADLRGGDLDVA